MTIDVANIVCMTIILGKGMKNAFAVKKQHVLEYMI